MTNSRHTLLYVEDDVDFAELNIGWLTDRGYRVVHAPNGTEALARCDETLPDLALLDVVLPDMKGFELCRRLQQRSPGLPVIFLTSLAEGRHAVEGLEAGACDYIRKDASIEEIDARIRGILARCKRNDGVIRLTERSSVDLRDQTILVNGIRHRVGVRIIRLLLLLDERRNSLCPRKTLIAGVWGGESINGEVYLNQAIVRLRHLLEEDPQLQITTRRFAGVMLTVQPAGKRG